MGIAELAFDPYVILQSFGRNLIGDLNRRILEIFIEQIKERRLPAAGRHHNKYTNTDSQKQTHKDKYTNKDSQNIYTETNTQRQIHKKKYTKTNKQIQSHKYKHRYVGRV